jgi:hypothetical protein
MTMAPSTVSSPRLSRAALARRDQTRQELIDVRTTLINDITENGFYDCDISVGKTDGKVNIILDAKVPHANRSFFETVVNEACLNTFKLCKREERIVIRYID